VKPDTVTIGNVGNGSLGHLASILVGQAAGVQLVPVAYKGGGPLHVDALGGQIDLAIASVAAQASHVRSGKLRALVQTGEKRSAMMADVPTLTEAGVRGVEPAYAFWGILAPAGTPRPIIDRLHGEIVKAIKLPEVNKTLTETLGMDVAALSPEATQQFINQQMARWGKVVKDNAIRVQ
jgi:tripartite-type tricarboxylate transporter receptor subunit TctC